MPPLNPALLQAMGGRPPSPVAGAGTLPGQPPFGSSPISAPVPHRGLQGEGVALISHAKQLLEKAIGTPGMGAETELGQAILKALEVLGKQLPEGVVTPGMERAGMEQFMLQHRQNAPMMNIMAAMGQGGAPGGAPPAAPPGPIPAG